MPMREKSCADSDVDPLVKNIFFCFFDLDFSTGHSAEYHIKTWISIMIACDNWKKNKETHLGIRKTVRASG